ncbi:MAG: zinc ribbon domain-containing protein [Nitrospirae bacterium]|nr:zinc ribbon domain-containing protein [Nitrospirota bacterium]
MDSVQCLVQSGDFLVRSCARPYHVAMDSTATSTQSCPKCQTDQPDGATECVKCGIIFAKYRPLVSLQRQQESPNSSRWVSLAKEWLVDSDTSTDSLTFAGRVAVFLLLVWWGRGFIFTPLETNYTGESFFHLINLPFHEAGHLLFIPLGRFMTILGGSLGQILMPLVCLATFLIKTRDPFGASVALWWTAESFMDIAPYINDARAMDLMLLGGVTGKETDGHDWNNILTMLDGLEYDHRLAHLTYNLGILLMLASFAWGGLLLVKQYRRLSP